MRNRSNVIVRFMAAAGLLWMAACSSSFLGGGWQNLMPGANLEGWTIVDVTADGPLAATPQWSVDVNTGTVRCAGTGGRDWLRCDKKEFADFILHVEWRFDKLADPKARYNSGVFVRNAGDWSIWHQAQAGVENAGYLFGNSPASGEPKRFTTRDQLKGNPLKPAGEWNVYDITCKGKTLSLAVNGVLTTAWDQCEVPKGYVGLEAEGFGIEFKNIRIKAL